MKYRIYLYSPGDPFRWYEGTASALHTMLRSTFPETEQLPLEAFTELLAAHQGPDSRLCFGIDTNGDPWIAPMAPRGPDTTDYLNEETAQ